MFSSWNVGKNLLLVETRSRSETFFIELYFIILFFYLEFWLNLRFLCQHFLFYVHELVQIITTAENSFQQQQKLFTFSYSDLVISSAQEHDDKDWINKKEKENIFGLNMLMYNLLTLRQTMWYTNLLLEKLHSIFFCCRFINYRQVKSNL
jgi:hypothetical protein